MEHGFLDKYSNLNSPLHRIDPRVKAVTFFITILFIVLTSPERFTAFLLYGALISILILLSRIPLFFILKKLLFLVPFVLLIAISLPFYNENGLLVLWNVVIKSVLSMLCMTLLSNTVSFTELLKALDSLKLPKPIIMILSFMYRYVYISVDELMRMNRARESRAASNRSRINAKFRTLSNIVGSLFVRSYERGEKVYLAMRSRGFSGEVKSMSHFHLTIRDLCFAAVIIAVLISIEFWI